MTTKNESIGEVECPAKGCVVMIPVYRFRARPNEKMQRFANKLYCRCPTHGQFGGQGSDDAMQTYIEENSRKCQPKNSEVSEAAKKLPPGMRFDLESPPEKADSSACDTSSSISSDKTPPKNVCVSSQESAPAIVATPQRSTPSKAPAIPQKKPAVPAPKEAPATPATEPAEPAKSTGWGFFS